MRKAFHILLLSAYLLGMGKLGLVYSTHNFFHHICNEQHDASGHCDGTCTIIINAEDSEKSADTKSFKVNVDNFSSHICDYFVFTPAVHKENFSLNNFISPPPEFIKLSSPPPKI